MKRIIGILAAVLLAGLGLAAGLYSAVPYVGPYAVSGPIPATQASGPIGNGVLTFTSSTSSVDLSSSQGTVTITGSGSVLSVNASGSYTFPSGGSLTNGAPTYAQTGGTLDIWLSANNGPWTISGSNTVGGSPVNYLIASTGPLAGQSFATTGGSAVSGGTAAMSGSWLSSGVSVPCHGLTLSTSTAGCMLSSGTAAGTVLIPANVPVTLPVTNVNQLYISGGPTPITLGWFYW